MQEEGKTFTPKVKKERPFLNQTDLVPQPALMIPDMHHRVDYGKPPHCCRRYIEGKLERAYSRLCKRTNVEGVPAVESSIIIHNSRSLESEQLGA